MLVMTWISDDLMQNFVTIMLDYHVSMLMFMLMFMSYWIFMMKHGFVSPMKMVMEYDMMTLWWDNDHKNKNMNCNMVLRWWHSTVICKRNKLDFLWNLLKIKVCMVYDLNKIGLWYDTNIHLIYYLNNILNRNHVLFHVLFH